MAGRTSRLRCSALERWGTGWRPVFACWHPDDRLEPPDRGGPGPGRARRGGRRDRCGRGAASRDRGHDGDRRRRRHLDRPGPGHARRSGAGRDLGPDEHHRRGGDQPRRGHGRGSASGRDASRRAGVGKQGTGRARPADDLRVRARRGARACRSAVRRARPAHDLGRRGRGRDAAEAGEQHLARVRDRSGGRVRSSCRPAGP